MADRTCVEADCDAPHASRGLCNRHYLEKRRRGELPPTATRPDVAGWHRVSDVDRETKTAVCSICGPVAVSIRASGRAQCLTARRSGRGDTPTGRDRTRWAPVTKEDRRRRKYRLSKRQYAALVKAAGGRCGICDIEFDSDGFHIDHCHETGLVRGLLCMRCNYALGWFDDSPPRILAAYLYLKASGKDDADWRHRAS